MADTADTADSDEGNNRGNRAMTAGEGFALPGVVTLQGDRRPRTLNVAGQVMAPSNGSLAANPAGDQGDPPLVGRRARGLPGAIDSSGFAGNRMALPGGVHEGLTPHTRTDQRVPDRRPPALASSLQVPLPAFQNQGRQPRAFEGNVPQPLVPRRRPLFPVLSTAGEAGTARGAQATQPSVRVTPHVSSQREIQDLAARAASPLATANDRAPMGDRLAGRTDEAQPSMRLQSSRDDRPSSFVQSLEPSQGQSLASSQGQSFPSSQGQSLASSQASQPAASPRGVSSNGNENSNSAPPSSVSIAQGVPVFRNEMNSIDSNDDPAHLFDLTASEGRANALFDVVLW
ncbi:MAG: hypothetical protein K0U36_05375 [Alphaproteobacteria bacterium]|nr:hypothetical protein [Alphaproteobacteria bacterium]